MMKLGHFLFYYLLLGEKSDSDLSAAFSQITVGLDKLSRC